MFAVSVADQLRAEIAAAGLTASEVARRISMDKSMLHRYLHSKRELPLSTLARICGGIGIDPSVVIERAIERIGRDSKGVGGSAEV